MTTSRTWLTTHWARRRLLLSGAALLVLCSGLLAFLLNENRGSATSFAAAPQQKGVDVGAFITSAVCPKQGFLQPLAQATSPVHITPIPSVPPITPVSSYTCALHIQGSFQSVLLSWVSDGESLVPTDYTIDISADSTNGANGTWTTMMTITNNQANGRAHLIPFAHQTWVRMSITRMRPGSQTSLPYASFVITLYDGSGLTIQHSSGTTPSPSVSPTGTRVASTPTSTAAPVTATATSAPTGVTVSMLFPAYWGDDANKWQTVMKQHVTGAIAIANFNAGPPAAADSTFASIVDQAHTAGLKVIGYVPTHSHDTTAIEAMINGWYRYNVDGIFLDEADITQTTSNVGFYGTLYSYIKSIRGAGTLTVLNAGWIPASPRT